MQKEHASQVWAILEAFGYAEIRKELEGHRSHRLDNVLTLEKPKHDLMDDLDLWFVAVDGQVRFPTHDLASGFNFWSLL